MRGCSVLDAIALVDAVMDRLKKDAGFFNTLRCLPETCEVDGGAQLPGSAALLARYHHRFSQTHFRANVIVLYEGQGSLQTMKVRQRKSLAGLIDHGAGHRSQLACRFQKAPGKCAPVLHPSAGTCRRLAAAPLSG